MTVPLKDCSKKNFKMLLKSFTKIYHVTAARDEYYAETTTKFLGIKIQKAISISKSLSRDDLPTKFRSLQFQF